MLNKKNTIASCRVFSFNPLNLQYGHWLPHCEPHIILKYSPRNPLISHRIALNHKSATNLPRLSHWHHPITSNSWSSDLMGLSKQNWLSPSYNSLLISFHKKIMQKSVVFRICLDQSKVEPSLARFLLQKAQTRRRSV